MIEQQRDTCVCVCVCVLSSIEWQLSEGALYLLWRDSDMTQISKGD